MEFQIGPAVIGGLVGTIVMTLAMFMGSKMMGLKMDMPMTLGTMFFPKGTVAWAAGLMVHLMMGVIFFIIYAAIFNGLGIRSGVAGWSAVFGVIHGLMAGVAFGMMPSLHPRMALAAGPSSAGESVPAPGFFGVRMGTMAPMAIIAVHALYGLVAGAIYTA